MAILKRITHITFKQVRELEGYRYILAMKYSQCNLSKMYYISRNPTLRNILTHNSTTTKMFCKKLTQ